MVGICGRSRSSGSGGARRGARTHALHGSTPGFRPFVKQASSRPFVVQFHRGTGEVFHHGIVQINFVWEDFGQGGLSLLDVAARDVRMVRGRRRIRSRRSTNSSSSTTRRIGSRSSWDGSSPRPVGGFGRMMMTMMVRVRVRVRDGRRRKGEGSTGCRCRCSSPTA